jgi:hypothetical protein
MLINSSYHVTLTGCHPVWMVERPRGNEGRLGNLDEVMMYHSDWLVRGVMQGA